MHEAEFINSNQQFVLRQEENGAPLKISFIVEWANTTYNGLPRFFGFLDIFTRQWQDLVNKNYPDDLEEAARIFLGRIDPEPEFMIISGEKIDGGITERIHTQCGSSLNAVIHVGEGLEYYALKNLGADLATGDILCFLDSDLFPDEGWLAYLLGTFANPQIRAAAGQPYVAPIDLFSRAFALGWTYDLPDPEGRLYSTEKFYANNVAFITELYRQYSYAPLKRRTRGSSALLGVQLMQEGYPVWQNGKALVDHPAPSGWKHLAIRAIAHGRDIYMKYSEERSFQGLLRSQKTAALRLRRGFSNTSRYWRKVGLRRPEVIPAMLIILSYYSLFSLGGLLTHVSPEIMGRHFRL
jgi:glycosyltransferase involved in cell wall biosynthesis